MAKSFAPCGLDCTQCEAYLTTQTHDQAGQERVLAKWKVEFNAPEMTLEDVTCDGCLAASGHPGGYRVICGIRKCTLEHGFATCAECRDYSCEKLEGFWKGAPEAKNNLESLRLK